jgi:hypothetical protein
MIKTLKVNRATWRCGNYGPNKHGEGLTLLFNEQKFMCCLGHCALQLGATIEDIYKKAGPSSVVKNLGPLHKEGVSSGLAYNAMKINDNEKLTQIEREGQLTKLFAEHDLELIFEGEYTYE